MENKFLSKKSILEISKVIYISIISLIVLFFVLGKLNHKGSLKNLELVASSSAGYVYKAKVDSKGFFSPNFIYKYSDRPIKFENEPDYIIRYGYNVKITRMPDWYNTSVGASAWSNEDGSFTVSNSTSWNGYPYDIITSKGERYRISVEIKKLYPDDTNKTETIKYYLDSANFMQTIPETEVITGEYKTYISEITIFNSGTTGTHAHFDLYFPQGVFNVKYVSVEQLNDSLYIKNNEYVIFTSSKEIQDTDKYYVIYKLAMNYHICIVFIVASILLVLVLKINKYIKFFIVFLIILFFNFNFNMFSIGKEDQFNIPDLWSDDIVISDLFLRSYSDRHNSIFMYTYFFRNFFDHFNISRFNDEKSREVIDNNQVAVYLSCLGTQSHFLRPVYNILIKYNSDVYLIFKDLAYFVASINALIFAILFTFMAIEIGIIPISIMAMFTIITNIWVSAFAKSIWWLLFSFIIPFLVVSFFVYKYNFKKHNILFFIILVLTIIFRLSMGYEFISTVFVSTTLPIFYFSISRKYSIKKFMKYFLIISGLCILGLLITLIIHTITLGGFEYIIETLKRRTINVVTDGGYEADLRISNLFYIYLFNNTYSYPYIYSLILLFIIFFIRAILLSYKNNNDYFGFKIKPEQYLGLLVCTIISFFGSLSSISIYKQHFFVHRHIDYLVFWIPFLFLLYSIILYRFDKYIFIILKNFAKNIINFKGKNFE